MGLLFPLYSPPAWESYLVATVGAAVAVAATAAVSSRSSLCSQREWST